MKTYRRYLAKLIILLAFPIHFWSILQIFQNVSWVAKRTGWGDAIGYGSYALLTALVETLLIFLITVPIFLLLTRKFKPDKALTITTLTYLTIALLWIFRFIMINHTSDPFFLDSFIHNLADQFGWRLRYRYLAILIAIITLNIPVVLVPILALRNDKLTGYLLAFADRVEILMYLLFGLDFVSIIVILVRNILGAL
jgi:hypothetical protein